jgi:hypothetical protein
LRICSVTPDYFERYFWAVLDSSFKRFSDFHWAWMDFSWGVLSFHWLARDFRARIKFLDETRWLVLSQSCCVQHSLLDFGGYYKESTSSDVQVPQQFQTDESFSKPEAIVLVCGALSAGEISNWFAMLYFLRAALTERFGLGLECALFISEWGALRFFFHLPFAAFGV